MWLLPLLAASAAADPPSGDKCGYCRLMARTAACSGPGLAEDVDAAPVAEDGGYDRLAVSVATAAAGGRATAAAATVVGS